MKKISLLVKRLLSGTIARNSLIAAAKSLHEKSENIYGSKHDLNVSDDNRDPHKEKEYKVSSEEDIKSILEGEHTHVMKMYKIPNGILIYAEDVSNRDGEVCKVLGKVLVGLNGTNVIKITKYLLKDGYLSYCDQLNVNMSLEYGLRQAIIALKESLPSCTFDDAQNDSEFARIVALIRNGKKHPTLSKHKIGYDVSVDTVKKECHVKFFEVGHAGENDAIAVMTYNDELNEVLIQTLKIQFPLSDTEIDYASSLDSPIYDVLVERVFPIINDYFDFDALDNRNAFILKANFFSEINKRKDKDIENNILKSPTSGISKLFENDPKAYSTAMEVIWKGLVDEKSCHFSEVHSEVCPSKQLFEDITKEEKLDKPNHPTIKSTLEVEYRIHERIIDETPCVHIELMNKDSKKALFDIRLVFDNQCNLYAYKKTSHCKDTINFANEELTLATPELSAELTLDSPSRTLHQNFLKEAEEQLYAKYNVEFGDSMVKIDFYKKFNNMIKYLSSRNKDNDVFEQMSTEVGDHAIYLHAYYHPTMFKVVFKMNTDGVFMGECKIYKKDVYWKDDEEFHMIFDNIIPLESKNAPITFNEVMHLAFNKLVEYTAEEVVYGKISINPYMIQLR